MIYITLPKSPIVKKSSFEDLLMGKEIFKPQIWYNKSNTVTYKREYISRKFDSKCPDICRIRDAFYDFCDMYHDFIEEHAKDPHKYYETFHIPKKSGGLREINAPKDELMNALNALKSIFESVGLPLYHTNAFAYIKNRSTIDAVKKHQKNSSKWFGKMDLSNFFGSTTMDFVINQLKMIYPFNYLIGDDVVIRKALGLAFLDGGLPQGTPISPLITNIIMIPIDYELTQLFNEFNGQKLIYTRYADDFIISSRQTFNIKEVEKAIINTLKEFNAPFSINCKKTRYGSSAGRNWNLGVMLNKDNEITIGYKNKQRFKAMLANYARDKQNGKAWDIHDIEVMQGKRSYYKMVEGKSIDDIVKHLSEKLGFDIDASIKQDLGAAI